MVTWAPGLSSYASMFLLACYLCVRACCVRTHAPVWRVRVRVCLLLLCILRVLHDFFVYDLIL